MVNRDPHQALKTEIVARHTANHLEALLVRLQWGKDDVAFSAHINPSSYTMHGMQQTDFLNYLGFSVSGCPFIAGSKCYVRWVEDSFDPKAFVESFQSVRPFG
jgi:hypothetical protein